MILSVEVLPYQPDEEFHIFRDMGLLSVGQGNLDGKIRVPYFKEINWFFISKMLGVAVHGEGYAHSFGPQGGGPAA